MALYDKNESYLIPYADFTSEWIVVINSRGQVFQFFCGIVLLINHFRVAYLFLYDLFMTLSWKLIIQTNLKKTNNQTDGADSWNNFDVIFYFFKNYRWLFATFFVVTFTWVCFFSEKKKWLLHFKEKKKLTWKMQKTKKSDPTDFNKKFW